jgi:hypothetical protein
MPGPWSVTASSTWPSILFPVISITWPALALRTLSTDGSEGAVYYEIFAPARTDQLPGWVGKSILRFD